ncbi:MAG: alpha/beta fold hydrolase [Candidatus Hydrogenedentes bacterium]|nr:alpha/beta fold hydrolase [Candidatus Hydrogenedentota bacterium]
MIFRRPRLFTSALALCLALSLAACGQRARLEDHDMVLNTSDGITLSAHIYRPVQANPPGLILVHRKGGRAALWEPLAVRAQQSGYLVVTFDLRGHGDSRDATGQPLNFKQFAPADWRKALFDLDAALQALVAAGADQENLFIAGEALGASLALDYASQNPALQGLVMLSPGLEIEGIAAEPLMEQRAQRPTLLVWAEGDAYAASSGTTLKAIAPGHIETHTYPGTAHGVDIFATSPQATGQIVVWLNQMLAGQATPATAAPN